MQTKIEIRHEALRLAVMMRQGKEWTAEEVVATAKIFEAYLTPAEPAKPKVLYVDGEEPPYGRYTDADNAPDAYWIHDAQGWRYADEDGPSGYVRTWREMRPYGPFTKVEEES